MTKTIEIPDFQIDDVKWKDHNVYVYYSPPNVTEAPDDSFIKIPLNDLYQWLEENDHLTIEMELPCFDSEQGLHYISIEDKQIEPEEFRLLHNQHTWPILRQYLEQFHIVNTFDSTLNAMNSIFSHFKKIE